jgi:5,5'-dehydrodivanillate O-demethylase
VEVPTEDESVAKTVRVRSYPTEEYLGLVFVYLGEGEAPSFPRYPDFEEGVLWVEAYVRPCNFFNNLENDPVHIPFAHRESEIFRYSPIEIPAKVDAEESEWGITLRTTFPGGRLHLSQHGWPNIISFKAPDRNHLAWRVPIDDEHHWSYQVDVMHVTGGEEGQMYRRRHAAREGKVGRSYIEVAEAVLRGELRIQDIRGDDAANLIWIQDYVTQVGQGAIADRKSERLIATDAGVLLQRKLWEREVKACAEGRSLKTWKRTERIINNYSHQRER